MFEIMRTNTILYCKNWSATVDFYNKTMELPVAYQSDWFIEFKVHNDGYLSVADEQRATIKSANGRGITLAWQVRDIHQAHDMLLSKKVEVSAVQVRWGAQVFYFRDPEGNRIELWQPVPEG